MYKDDFLKQKMNLKNGNKKQKIDMKKINNIIIFHFIFIFPLIISIYLHNKKISFNSYYYRSKFSLNKPKFLFLKSKKLCKVFKKVTNCREGRYCLFCVGNKK